MPQKPKKQYRSGLDQLRARDLFQTPAYAVTPLLPYLAPFDEVDEPACGEGYLVRALRRAGKLVYASDLQLGVNYFGTMPRGQVQVANVPFGKKYEWVRQALRRGQPFALLMPTDVICAGSEFQPLMRQYGLCLLVPDKRINFKTPFQQWDSSAQVHTSWVTWQLGLPEQLTFCEIKYEVEEPLSDEERICPPQLELAQRLMAEEQAEEEERERKKQERQRAREAQLALV